MENFIFLITKPDNIAILMLIFAVIFFGLLAFYKAIDNDKRLEKGKCLWEDEIHNKEKVYTWPNLLSIELITAISVIIILILWSTFFNAPLEEQANFMITPNPSKAPWYFLGLQEMLVYFDTWIAGFLLPFITILGLILIPYIDTNPKGNGYYSFKDRKLAISIFLFAYLLWIFLIVIGTFFRGSNWNFFMPWEYWDINKIVPMVNRNFSDLIGINPQTYWLIRELPAIILLSLYFIGIPILVKKYYKSLYENLGITRFSITMLLFLLLISLPIKMILHWIFHLKYLLVTPWFNI